MSDLKRRPIGIDDPEEISFLHEIIADPDNDFPRLVYADWLDEQGRTARAEFIRLQCAIEDPALDDGDRHEMDSAANRLRKNHENRWLGRLYGSLGPRTYRRGFFESVDLGAVTTRQRITALFQWLPQGTLRISSYAGKFDQLVRQRGFRQVRHLVLSYTIYTQAYYGPDAAEQMLLTVGSSRRAASLTELTVELSADLLDLDAVARFLSESDLPALERMTIVSPGLFGSRRRIKGLLSWSNLPNLRTLAINGMVVERNR